MPVDIYLGQIISVAFNFAPDGWALCDGRLLDIDSNEALFHLLGTAYGGDGVSNFRLPDLRGRAALCRSEAPGPDYPVGKAGGVEQVTLTTAQSPPHNHAMAGSEHSGGYWPPPPYPPPKTTPPAPGPGMVLATNTQGAVNIYGITQPWVALSASSITLFGKALPHENRQPYLPINYIIATEGIVPTP